MELDKAERQTQAQNMLQNLLRKINEKVVLIGEGSGATMAWLAADVEPDLVACVVAVEPSGPPFGNIKVEKDSGIRVFQHTTRYNGTIRRYGLADIPLSYDPPIEAPTDLMDEIGPVFGLPVPPSKDKDALALEARKPLFTLKQTICEQDTRKIAWLQAVNDNIPVAINENGEEYPPQSQPNRVRELYHLKKVPHAVVTAHASSHTVYDWATVAFLRQAGCDVSWLKLEEHNILGNGHLMFLETNSNDVAELIASWVIEKLVALDALPPTPKVQTPTPATTPAAHLPTPAAGPTPGSVDKDNEMSLVAPPATPADEDETKATQKKDDDDLYGVTPPRRAAGAARVSAPSSKKKKPAPNTGLNATLAPALVPDMNAPLNEPVWPSPILQMRAYLQSSYGPNAQNQNQSSQGAQGTQGTGQTANFFESNMSPFARNDPFIKLPDAAPNVNYGSNTTATPDPQGYQNNWAQPAMPNLGTQTQPAEIPAHEFDWMNYVSWDMVAPVAANNENTTRQQQTGELPSGQVPLGTNQRENRERESFTADAMLTAPDTADNSNLPKLTDVNTAKNKQTAAAETTATQSIPRMTSNVANTKGPSQAQVNQPQGNEFHHKGISGVSQLRSAYPGGINAAFRNASNAQARTPEHTARPLNTQQQQQQSFQSIPQQQSPRAQAGRPNFTQGQASNPIPYPFLDPPQRRFVNGVRNAYLNARLFPQTPPRSSQPLDNPIMDKIKATNDCFFGPKGVYANHGLGPSLPSGGTRPRGGTLPSGATRPSGDVLPRGSTLPSGTTLPSSGTPLHRGTLPGGTALPRRDTLPSHIPPMTTPPPSVTLGRSVSYDCGRGRGRGNSTHVNRARVLPARLSDFINSISGLKKEESEDEAEVKLKEGESDSDDDCAVESVGEDSINWDFV